jgi:hypothetical protein
VTFPPQASAELNIRNDWILGLQMLKVATEKDQHSREMQDAPASGPLALGLLSLELRSIREDMMYHGVQMGVPYSSGRGTELQRPQNFENHHRGQVIMGLRVD